jgi:hypothetical protein
MKSEKSEHGIEAIVEREVARVLNAPDNYDNEEMVRAACLAVARAVVEEAVRLIEDFASAGFSRSLQIAAPIIAERVEDLAAQGPGGEEGR